MMEVDRTHVGHRETDAFDPKQTLRRSLPEPDVIADT